MAEDPVQKTRVLSKRKHQFWSSGNSYFEVSSKQQQQPAPFLCLWYFLFPLLWQPGRKTVFGDLWILGPEGGSGRLFKEQKRAVPLCTEEKKIILMIQERSGWSCPFPLFHINYKSWLQPPHLLRKGPGPWNPVPHWHPTLVNGRWKDKRKEVSLLNPQEFFDEIILQTEMSLLLFVLCLASV